MLRSISAKQEAVPRMSSREDLDPSVMTGTRMIASVTAPDAT